MNKTPKPSLSDLVDRLLADDAVAKTDKGDLTLAHNAKVQAQRGYNDAPGKLTKSDMDAAREHYTDTVTRLARQYYPDDAPEEPEDKSERFKNKLEALIWLNKNGYKVSQGKFYGDCKNGTPPVRRDGSVSKYAVRTYADTLKTKGPDNPDYDLSELNKRRAEADTRKAISDANIQEMKEEEMKREMDRRWLYRDQALMDLAAIWEAVQQALDHAIHVGAEALCVVAGGDPERAYSLEESIQELVIARAFNEVAAAGKIHVKFKGEDEP